MDSTQTTTQCPQCGASVDVPAGRISFACNYCSAPMVDEVVAKAHIHRVAPFSFPKKAAENKLAEHLRRQYWAPEEVRKGLVKHGKLRGVLVPFRAYTGVARSKYKARIGIHWYRTETYKDSKGKTKTRRVKETEWFSLKGTSVLPLDDHLASASIELPEKESNALEPFDTGHAVSLDSQLLSGWEAYSPSLEAEQSEAEALKEIQGRASTQISRRLLPGDVSSGLEVTTKVNIDKVDTVLLPVWMAKYQHGEKEYWHYVNGQTGKYVGVAPTSWVKVGVAIAVAVATVVAIYFGVL